MNQYSYVSANNSRIQEQVNKILGYWKDLNDNNFVDSNELENAVYQYKEDYYYPNDANAPLPSSSIKAIETLKTFVTSGSMSVEELQSSVRQELSNTVDSDLAEFLRGASAFKTVKESGNALDKQIVSKYKETAIHRWISGLPMDIVSKTGKLSKRDQDTLSKIENFIDKYPGLKMTMKLIKTKVSLLLSTRDITYPYYAFNIGLDSSRDALMISRGNEDYILNELNEIYDRQNMSEALISNFRAVRQHDALSTALDRLYLDKINNQVSPGEIKTLFVDYEQYVKDISTDYVSKGRPISETFKEEIKSLLIERVQRYCGSNHTKEEIESVIDFRKMFEILDQSGRYR